MRFIVDELPDYESDCPFYDLKAGVCKLDGEYRYQYSDPEGCPHLKVLEEKCNVCLEYHPIELEIPEMGRPKGRRM